MTAWADHGQAGNGEPLAIMLRPGKAGSNTAADHAEAARLALAQLPRRLRSRVLIGPIPARHARVPALVTARSRPLHYSIGMTVTADMQAALLQVPAKSLRVGQLDERGKATQDIFGCVYYAALRPEEVTALRKTQKFVTVPSLRFARHGRVS